MFIPVPLVRPSNVKPTFLPQPSRFSAIVLALGLIGAASAQPPSPQSPDSQSPEFQAPEFQSTDSQSTPVDPDPNPTKNPAPVAEVQQLPSDPLDLQSLLKQLSSPDYATRERATQSIMQIEDLSIEAIRQFADDSDDMEVQLRCKSIADAIYQRRLGDRIRKLLTSSEEEAQAVFSGWKPFADVFGSSRLAKRLFANLITTFPELAELDSHGETDRPQITQLVNRIAIESNRTIMKLQQVPFHDTLALLYLSSRLEGEVSADVEGAAIRLVRLAPFTVEASVPQYQPVIKRLLGKWLTTLKSNVAAGMLVSLDHSVPEGAELARRMLENPNQDPSIFELAIACITRFGNQDDVPLLERFMNDERMVAPPIARQVPRDINAPRIESENPLDRFGPSPGLLQTEMVIFEVQFRDMALAASMALLDADMDQTFPRAIRHPTRGFLASSLGFPQNKPAERQAAFDNWQKLKENLTPNPKRK